MVFNKKKLRRFLLSFCALIFSANNSFAIEAQKQLPVDINKDSPRRVLGVKPDPNSVEGGMWLETAKAEKQGLSSGERTKHKELEQYIQSIMDKIVPDNKGDIRVIVMDRPFFNATVTPNGYSEVWSGLLLRVTTEDELAFVLGHEAGHFLHSHFITAFEAYKDRQRARMVTGAIITVAAAAVAGNAGTYQQASEIMNIASSVNDILYLGSIFAYFGFSRDQEAYADLHGYEIAKKAGYYPRSGESLWHEVLTDQAASDDERVRKSKTFINIFNTHPLEEARINYLAIYNTNNGNEDILSEEKLKNSRINYRNKIRPYLSEWLSQDLKRHDYGQTINIINRQSIDNLDIGVLSFFKGECYRLRAKNNDIDKAIEAYLNAIKYNDAPPEAYRQIGEIYRKQSKFADAKKYYQTYLEKNPNAEDAWIIEDNLKIMENNINLTKQETSNLEKKNAQK